MNIHQLSVNYVQEQDRILVRVNTTSNEELRLWFTRRLTLNLLPMMQKIVTEWIAKQESLNSGTISPVSGTDPQTQQMIAQFKREESLQQADFKTPYRPPNSLPLGTEPLLVTELSVTPLKSGQLQMSFTEKLPLESDPSKPNTRGFRVALEEKLVHGFLHLLEKAVQTSNWSTVSSPTPVDTVGTASGEDATAAPNDRPRYLN